MRYHHTYCCGHMVTVRTCSPGQDLAVHILCSNSLEVPMDTFHLFNSSFSNYLHHVTEVPGSLQDEHGCGLLPLVCGPSRCLSYSAVWAARACIMDA